MTYLYANYGKIKKAQIKIQQMAFILLAITLLFVFAGIFILTIMFSNLKQTAVSLQGENSMLLVTKLANSPEFSCGESFGTGQINCIDEDKVMILKGNIGNYSGFWGVQNIAIRIIYPPGNDTLCTLANYPNCNLINFLGSNITSENSNFVSLCRKNSASGTIANKCQVAKLLVSYGQ